MRSLKYNFMIVELVKSYGIDIQWHGKKQSEPAHYCHACDVSVSLSFSSLSFSVFK